MFAIQGDSHVCHYMEGTDKNMSEYQAPLSGHLMLLLAINAKLQQ